MYLSSQHLSLFVHHQFHETTSNPLLIPSSNLLRTSHSDSARVCVSTFVCIVHMCMPITLKNPCNDESLERSTIPYYFIRSFDVDNPASSSSPACCNNCSSFLRSRSISSCNLARTSMLSSRSSLSRCQAIGSASHCCCSPECLPTSQHRQRLQFSTFPFPYSFLSTQLPDF